MMKRITACVVALLSIGCSSQAQKADLTAQLPKTIEEAASSSVYRSPENLERDKFRHPVETLRFFGLTQEMSVVEIEPGGGWYMEILAPYLTLKGKYKAAVSPAGDKAYMIERRAKINKWFDAHAAVKQKTSVSTFDPKSSSEIAPPNSADLVLTFRNVHNWIGSNSEKAAFKSFFRALKPGGILGVVEHRANPKTKAESMTTSGYVTEEIVIKIAEAEGFKLESKSEINANPKDTKNYPEGVWTLPPSLRLKEKDRARYMAIGESDRMTLKFVKPIKK